MNFYIDSVFVKNDVLNIVGWAAGASETHAVEFSVTKDGKEVPCTVTRGSRPDVAHAFFHDASRSEVGFFLQIDAARGNVFAVTAKSYLNGVPDEQKTRVFKKREIGLKNKLQETHRELISYRYRDTGLYYRVNRKVRNPYNTWFKNYRATPAELEKMRKTHFEYTPFFSILVPVYRTPVPYLRDMLSSVVHQIYPNFELCIVNADPEDEKVRQELGVWCLKDDRIRVQELTENRNIAGNTNAALAMAKGDFIALLDHDDRLEYDSLWQIVKRLNEKPETDLLYTDEDKITELSDWYYFPNFKPDYNLDMLLNNNYISHFLCVRRSLAEEVGGWSDEYNGAQDHDFILKCTEHTDRIEHIARVLYHWRVHSGSTAGNNAQKSYASDAGVRAVNAHYERLGIKAKAEPAAVGGWYVTRYELEKKPLVSVLIPNKDHTDDLDICIRSLEEKCTYKNVEIIVIENNSTEDETFRYYESVQERYENVKVVTWPGTGFNFSAINNYGETLSKGEYLMLLNNDTEVISEDLFERMLGFMSRPEVGMVGCKLLYNDRTVQHAGVLIGGGGLADHMFKSYKDETPGYMCRNISSYDVSCVTAACLMVRRSVYEEVGGLEEELAVAFNDVDFCLKVREKGYLIVYDAESKLFHYESKSRGAENTPEKFSRFGREMSYLHGKWERIISENDPNYNPNMSYVYQFVPNYFNLRRRTGELGADYIKDTGVRDEFLEYMSRYMSKKNRKVKKDIEHELEATM